MRLITALFFYFLIFICSAQNEHLFGAPLDIKLLPSGSFSEIRTNHFHSGIDLRTEEKVGLPIYAPADGYVSRIYINSVGFGKALYIDHPSGHTTVYGHLLKFNDTIKQYAESQQYASESFMQNLFPPKDSLKVTKGDIIAYSGNTGSSGGPHLHYEVRDTESENPLNPLAYGIKIKDTKRPHFKGLKLYPIEGKGVLSGKGKSRYFTAVNVGKEFRLKGNPKIYVYGELGVGASVLDYMDGSWAKCGITEMRVFLDNELYYHHNTNRLSFDHQIFMNAFIDFEERQRSYKRVIKGFKDDDNNPLQVYKHLKNEGKLILNSEGKHEIKVEIQDYAGNKSVCRFNVYVKKQAIPEIKQPSESIWVDWASGATIDEAEFSVDIPSEALLKSQFIQVSSTSNNAFLSNKLTVGSKYIPLTKSLKLTFKKPLTTYNDSLLYIAKVSGNRMAYPIVTNATPDGQLHAATRYFGEYAVMIDTVAPRLRSIDLFNGKRIPRYRNIRFSFSDSQSGVKHFRGEVDGAWALFDFDAKSRVATYWLDEKRIGRNKKHTVNFTVTDNCGNQKSYKASFYW